MSRIGTPFSRIHQAFTNAKTAVQNNDSNVQQKEHPHCAKIKTFIEVFHRSLFSKNTTSKQRTCRPTQHLASNTEKIFDFKLLAKLQDPTTKNEVDKKIETTKQELKTLQNDSTPNQTLIGLKQDQLNILNKMHTLLDELKNAKDDSPIIKITKEYPTLTEQLNDVELLAKFKNDYKISLAIAKKLEEDLEQSKSSTNPNQNLITLKEERLKTFKAMNDTFAKMIDAYENKKPNEYNHLKQKHDESSNHLKAIAEKIKNISKTSLLSAESNNIAELVGNFEEPQATFNSPSENTSSIAENKPTTPKPKLQEEPKPIKKPKGTSNSTPTRNQPNETLEKMGRYVEGKTKQGINHLKQGFQKAGDKVESFAKDPDKAIKKLKKQTEKFGKKIENFIDNPEKGLDKLENKINKGLKKIGQKFEKAANDFENFFKT